MCLRRDPRREDGRCLAAPGATTSSTPRPLHLFAVLSILLFVVVCWGRGHRRMKDSWQERLGSARAHREASAASKVPQEVVSAGGGWIATLEMQSSSVQRVSIRDAKNQPLRFEDVLSLWEHDGRFAEFYVSLLAKSPFDSFFWECPPISKATLATRPYEHVTVRAHPFASASPDSFAEHLNACTQSATSFTNLGGDATLVAPCSREPPLHAYGHLAAFTRGVPLARQVELWQTVGATARQTLERRGAAQRTWLSTEGSGVPWLHVRMDSSPKYYHHGEYAHGEK